jgi:hypothetical protein
VLKRDKGDWRIFLEHSSPIADVPRMKPLASSQGAAVNPPKSAVNTFNRILALLKAGDIDAAAKYFNAPDPEMAEGLKRAANRLQSGQLTVTLVDSKEEGDLAVVIVKAVDVDQGEEAGALYEANAMRRTDGTWRVYGTKIRAPGTKAASEADAKGKIEKPPKAKKEVPPSTWEPDINLEGTDKEKMAVLWKWAQARCAELRKDSKKPARPNIPPDGPNIPPTGDFKQTKEWQALNRLVGSWDYLVTSSDPKTNQGRISSTAAWTLGDRFLQFRSRRGNNTESMSLLTYDPNRGVIRWWYFSSLGQTTGFSGVWDETTNTFTFKEQETGPMTSISIDHFIDDDHRELKDIIKGPDGKVVLEMSYKGTRQKRTSQAPGKAQGAVKPPSAGAAGG